MTWLGYEIVLTNDQKVWALLIAMIFALFGRIVGGKSLAVCLAIIPFIYVLCVVYAINENAMYQLKAEFCDKHREIDRCAPYWH